MGSKRTRLIVSAMLCATGSGLMAQEPVCMPTSWDYLENNSRLAIGGEGFHRQVKNKTTGEEAEGGWGGIYGVYSYEERDAVFFQLDGRADWGNLEPDHGRIYSHDSNNMQWNLEALVGYMFGLGDQNDVGIAPFMGIGYEKNQLHMDGRWEHLRWWYVPFGLRCDYQVTPTFDIALLGYIGPTFNGHFHIGHNDGGDDGLRSGKFHNKYRWELEAPFTWVFADWCSGQMDVSIVPFWYGWNTGERYGNDHHHHDEDRVVPQMRSSEGGARLEIGVRF
jgi:hypothetical protein